ncbi:MAG: hypothetical protein LBQ59_05495 [Candidatus Peribacteria bacterium]|jgi:hypothetical protein|nr:hypothetical protein [Candidatus Peribacteria bacterium]
MINGTRYVILGSGLHPRLRENERGKLLLSLIRRGWVRYGVRVVGNLSEK